MTISTTQTWLKNHPEDNFVRTQYLAFLSRWGTAEQRRTAIATTQTWLESHPEDTNVRGQYLAFLSQFGTIEQKRTAIATTQTWLQQHLEDTSVRTKFLAFLTEFGTPEQKRTAIATTQTWLQQHPEDNFVREQYLAFLSQWGTAEQRQAAIATTQTWLQKHLEDTNVREQYLAFLSRWGTVEEKQAAIATTQTWLQQHPEDTNVRTQFLAFIGKQRTDIGNIADLIIEQWQWLSEQRQASQNFWSAFLPVVYHHASPKVYFPIIKLAFQQHSEDAVIQNLIFGYFRDYLDQVTCYALATNVSQSRLPPDKWHTQICAANFFRDQGEFDKAEKIYRRTFGAARAQVTQMPALAKVIDFINVSYAQLLLLTDPPCPDAAIRKLNWVLKKNSKHGYAHLLMAQAFQIKGESCFRWAKAHFEKAVKFDNWLKGTSIN